MEKSLLAKKILKICKLQGSFQLRSGLKSSEYFDKYLFEGIPSILDEVTSLMQDLIPKDTELLAGLEMGGIPIATSLSLKTQIPCRFVRKQAKDYGTQKLCEGGDIQGRKLCLIEDVITTGGQVLLSAKELRERGARIDTVLCVIHRGEDLSKLEEAKLNVRALFTKKELV